MAIIFKKTSAGSVPTPSTSHVAFFVDTTSGLPRLKTDTGSLISLGTNFSVSSIATSTVTATVGSVQRVNVSSAAVTVNLPAGHQVGDQIIVKLVSVATNNCTVDPNSSETIDGATTLILSNNYEWVTLVSDGTNWAQIG